MSTFEAKFNPFTQFNIIMVTVAFDLSVAIFLVSNLLNGQCPTVLIVYIVHDL